ncbi:MAG: AAA family ATPase [Chthoniobacteraceae bacterium]
MKSKLKEISLTAFRGASRPLVIEFQSDKSITMIFGENGTGKTTIVDAFEFVCDQKFGTLDILKVQDKGCIASVNTKPADLRVALTTDAGSWEAKLRGRKIEVSPVGQAPDIHVLRRANILRLIEAEPSKRYGELAGFIAAPQIEKVETTLRSATQHVAEEVSRYSALVAQAENLLEENWGKEGRVGESSVAWAQTVRGTDVSGQKAVLAEIQTFTDAIRDLGRSYDAIGTAKVKVGPAKTAYDNALAEQQKEVAKTVNQNPDLVRLLQQAQQYIGGNAADQTCPVCQQGVERDALLGELQRRVAEMSVLSQTVSSAERQKTAWDAAVAAVVAKEDSFIEDAATLAASVAHPTD